MNKIKTKNLLEYSSLSLILSYILIHNIIPVFIGIILSLYLINIDFINKIGSSINKVFNNSKTVEDNDIDYTNSNLNIKNNKNDTKLSLVETIEELGYVPSVEKKIS